MENKAEIFSKHDANKHIEEYLMLDVKGLPYSVYQKRILGEKAGG
jgi:hypothetical protein